MIISGNHMRPFKSNLEQFRIKNCNRRYYKDITQLKFTCSKSTIETLGKGAKYVQS